MSIEFRLKVIFYKSESRNEPVREWLKSLPRSDRKIIGEDIKTVQLGWPLGMPLVRKLDVGLWEVRSKLDNRFARVLFTVEKNVLVLLHGFIKKSEKTPAGDLNLAKKRLATLRS
jgi:phage-related protein